MSLLSPFLMKMSIRAVEQRIEWSAITEAELGLEEQRLLGLRAEIQVKLKEIVKGAVAARKRVSDPLSEAASNKPSLPPIPDTPVSQSHSSVVLGCISPSLTCPPDASSPNSNSSSLLSVMKGANLTSTGETLPTLTPHEIGNLFTESPKLDFSFGNVFELSSSG
ncbi:hypothetical protein BKA70DRAFT_1244419 [Coprinopsis sp. MPI-PUGE-AT-0042]|nr:hypothetical protein BKA70DRAFT_1244419 [Coprinopsis sp. MPI-PUGE-AT-0042]